MNDHRMVKLSFLALRYHQGTDLAMPGLVVSGYQIWLISYLQQPGR